MSTKCGGVGLAIRRGITETSNNGLLGKVYIAILTHITTPGRKCPRMCGLKIILFGL